MRPLPRIFALPSSLARLAPLVMLLACSAPSAVQAPATGPQANETDSTAGAAPVPTEPADREDEAAGAGGAAGETSAEAAEDSALGSDATPTAAELRALVTHAVVGDPLRFALRFAEAPSARPLAMRTILRIDPLEVVIMREGQEIGSAIATVEMIDRIYHSSPTVVLELTPAGAAEYGGRIGAWRGTKGAFLPKPGAYGVVLRGVVHGREGEPARFATASIPLEIGKPASRRSLAQLVQRARAELNRRVPAIAKGKVKLASKPWDTESAFRAGVVVETDGGLVVRFASVGGTMAMWGHKIYSVTLDPRGKVIDFHQGEFSTCIGAGTTVEGEAGPIAVESLTVGTKVWGYDTQRRARTLTTVRAVEPKGRRPVHRIGSGLTVTANHPVWADGKWRPAEDVRIGSHMIATDGDTTIVASAELPSASPPVMVYDITVDTPHTFFAGGLLVHNKSRFYDPTLDDPWLMLWQPPLH